jgi:hypothetical protein
MFDAGQKDLANFAHVSFVADRAVHYMTITPDLEIMPLEGIDLRAGEKYIVMRAPVGALTRNALKGFITDARMVFSSSTIRSTIRNNPAKLEISAREGLDGQDADSIKDEINRAIGPGSNNPIGEVEVLLPKDQGSIQCTIGADGFFDKWQKLP